MTTREQAEREAADGYLLNISSGMPDGDAEKIWHSKLAAIDAHFPAVEIIEDEEENRRGVQELSDFLIRTYGG